MIELLTDPTFAVGAAFVVFMALIAKPLFSAMNKGLEDRGSNIASGINEAETLRNEAEEILATIKRKQKKAIEEAETIVADAKKAAKQLLKDAESKLADDVARRTETAIQKIALAEQVAMNEIKSNAVDVTVSAARTLITEQLDNDEANALLMQAVTDLDKRYN